MEVEAAPAVVQHSTIEPALATGMNLCSQQANRCLTPISKSEPVPISRAMLAAKVEAGRQLMSRLSCARGTFFAQSLHHRLREGRLMRRLIVVGGTVFLATAVLTSR